MACSNQSSIFDFGNITDSADSTNGTYLTDATKTYLQSVANAYKYGVWVWIHSVIEHMSSTRKRQLSAYDRGLAKSMLSFTKEQAISSCLASMLGIPNGQPCEAALVFLMFLVGCETDSSTECNIVFDRMKALEENLHIGNVRRVRQFLEHVRDSKGSPGGEQDWQVLLEGKCWDLILS